MRLGWMVFIVCAYIVITGLFSAWISDGWMVLVNWFSLIFIWNKFIAKRLPPVDLKR